MKKFILISAVALVLTACGDGGVSDYEKGVAFNKADDRPNAIKFLKKAADQDHAAAAYILSRVYLNEFARTYNNDYYALSHIYECLGAKNIGDAKADTEVLKFIHSELRRYAKSYC